MLRSAFQKAFPLGTYYHRYFSMQAMSAPKKEGDISDSFASMSGQDREPLPDRYRELKLSLAKGRETDIQQGWNRLLKELKQENDIVASQKSKLIPVIDFNNLDDDLLRLKDEVRKRGAAVIRGVIPEAEARAYKTTIEEYVRKNPTTRGFPADNPQVLELYWSLPQLQARAHPNLTRVQKALMGQLWHVSSPSAVIDTSRPLAYADRLRIRQPGDAKFALGPHQDGGGVERWEREGYGRGAVYDAVLGGAWEAYDPWDAAGRVDAVNDRYGGLGACSMFRMFQGWLSMSRCGPRQGTLLVNPLLRQATAYTLLRPFFRPVKNLDLDVDALADATQRDAFLDPDNWVFTAGEEMTSELQGATPGHGQEFPPAMHPHLELGRTMVHIPDVKPGDFVIWHCDTIHAVDKIHQGTSDASVLYIPVCPVTEHNARYLVRQRAAFEEGTPGPDFPGGKGESEHIGRPTRDAIGSAEGLQAMGLERLPLSTGVNEGAQNAVVSANAILGF